MHHGLFEVHDKFQGNFTLSLCLRTLRPHHTRSVTSLPVNIFYRKIKKDLSLEGNTPSSTLHLLKETASSTHEETKVMCHSWTSIGAAWFCSISLLCCPRGRAAPLFHLWTPQAGGAHRSPTMCVSNTPLARPPGRPKAVSWGGVRCDSSPSWHNWGLLCLSAFLIQSANLPGSCIPLQQVTSGCVNSASSESQLKEMRLDLYCKTVGFICLGC